MIIIHAMETLPRLVGHALRERLPVMPAVVVTGARQTGKSTLAERLVPGRRLYRSLDNLDVLDAARRDPEALVGGSEPVTFDEVQREPGLLRAVKRAIDRERAPGRFLITGSANLLLMRQVADSLAGRASYLTLWPMTRREQRGLGRCGLWDELLSARDEEWREVLVAEADDQEDWRALARRGGLPTPAFDMTTLEERVIWFDGYVRTYQISGVSCARPACVSANSSTRQSSVATRRCRSPPRIAGSTCSRRPTCWYAFPPMP